MISLKHALLTILVFLGLIMVTVPIHAQNNPYVDDKLLHFGFFLGTTFSSYAIEERSAENQIKLNKNDTTYHARVSAPAMGVAVGFVSDLRLTRYLSLRFCPALQFVPGTTITYTSDQLAANEIRGNACSNNKPSILSLPISVPLYLKWSAEREMNYRPYVMAGGGITYDVVLDKTKCVVLPKPFDCFIEVGLGCDFYFRWFKFCPELRYRIGLLNVVTSLKEGEDMGWVPAPDDRFYTNAIRSMTNQQISLIFNFE